MTYETNQLDRVIDLLKDGTDLKQLEQKTDEAIAALRKADAIIDEHDLPDPWPQLVQYRLAHLLLRNAGKNIELLEEIDQLFIGATKANCLGPLPRLYRLAAMHRLGKKPKEMKTVFESLIAQVDHYKEDDPHDEYVATFGRITALQTHFFNMIELASYFTSYPYSEFEGIGRIKEPISEGTIASLGLRHGLIEDRNPFSDLLCKLKSWHLLGTVPGLSTKEYPGELAIVELESRMNRKEIEPPCIAFKISEDQSIHQWNINLEKDDDGFVWKKVDKSSKNLRYLASIYKFKNLHNKNNVLMYMFQYDGDKESNKLRKWKERCSAAILKEFNKVKYAEKIYSKDNLFLNENMNTLMTSQLHRDISVIGAVDYHLEYGVPKDDTI